LEEEKVLNFLSEIEIPKLIIEVDKLDILPGKENSYVLVFLIKKNF